MASPEELTPLLPETLPEDFGEWDGEASAEPSPIKPGEWEAWEATHSFGEHKSPHGQSTDRGSRSAAGRKAACIGCGPVRTGHCCSAKAFRRVGWRNNSYAQARGSERMGSVGSCPFLRQESKTGEAIC